MAARYRKLRKVADGGMAEIFLGIQRGAEGFERRVVLKQILAPLFADPKFRNMMVDEAHVAMSLNHGNIAQVLDLGESKGRYFLVLELVDGWDLNRILARVRDTAFPVPPELALYIVGEVCRALNYAHAMTRDGTPLGIVHRDISPHNVLVSDQGEVKLTDFGIAKAQGRRERTGQGVIKGKLAFLSPEQASGLELDGRSDLFSVGTMLYVLFTGRRPFEAPTDLEVILRIRQGQYTPPLELNPSLPTQIVRILDKALQRDPAQRYQSGEEMLDDLEAAQRSVYKPAGQTELKRWLAALGARDHGVPISRTAPLPGELDQIEDLYLAEDEPDPWGGDSSLQRTIPDNDAARKNRRASPGGARPVEVDDGPLAPTLAAGRGVTASEVVQAAESLQRLSESPPDLRFPPLGPPGTPPSPIGPPRPRLPPSRRRWLLAGIFGGVVLGSGLVAAFGSGPWRWVRRRALPFVAPDGPESQTGPNIEEEATEPTAGSEATDPVFAGAQAPAPDAAESSGSLPDGTAGTDALPTDADAGDARLAPADPQLAGADPSADETDEEEDEEALLQRQEPTLPDEVLGEDGVAVDEAGAPTEDDDPDPAAQSNRAAAGAVHQPSSRAPSRSPIARSPDRALGKPTPRNAPAAPPKAASVQIVSRPKGAVIKLGRRVFGRAPMSLRFRPGQVYELTFVKSGYQTTRKKFKVTGRSGQRVGVTLRRNRAKRKPFFKRIFGL